MTRWDAETNVKFIEEYQRQVCLWDPRHPTYKHRDSRESAYKNIAEAMEMDMTIKTVIAKIRSLRNTYNNEMLKMKKSELSGMGTDELYNTRIPWIRSLDFLKNVECYIRNNKDNIQDTSTQKLQQEDKFFLQIPPPLKKKKKIRPFPKANALEKMSSQNAISVENEFEIFGRNVAVQLQKMPLEIALKSQELVLSVLRQQRIKAMRMQSNDSELGSQSSSESLSLSNDAPLSVETIASAYATDQISDVES